MGVTSGCQTRGVTFRDSQGYFMERCSLPAITLHFKATPKNLNVAQVMHQQSYLSPVRGLGSLRSANKIFRGYVAWTKSGYKCCTHLYPQYEVNGAKTTFRCCPTYKAVKRTCPRRSQFARELMWLRLNCDSAASRLSHDQIYLFLNRSSIYHEEFDNNYFQVLLRMTFA